MCTYTIAKFSCRHEIWGQRTKLCTIGEDFRDGHIEADCTLRTNHPLKTMMVSQPCYDCFKLKALPELCRSKLQEARSAFKERWPEEALPKQADGNSPVETAAGPLGFKEKVKNTTLHGKKHSPNTSLDIDQIDKTKGLRKLVLPTLITNDESMDIALERSDLAAPAAMQSMDNIDEPVPKSAPSKLPPPRASRLALPTRKVPEEQIASSAKTQTQVLAKVGSKIPKPGFLRK